MLQVYNSFSRDDQNPEKERLMVFVNHLKNVEVEKGEGVGKNRGYRDPLERPTTEFLRRAGRVRTAEELTHAVRDLMIQEGKPRAVINKAFSLPVSPLSK